MDRLRQLRLARAVTSTKNQVEKPSTADVRPAKQSARARSSLKKSSLMDWLAKREHDGFGT
jgi:hypothetical protein